MNDPETVLGNSTLVSVCMAARAHPRAILLQPQDELQDAGLTQAGQGNISPAHHKNQNPNSSCQEGEKLREPSVPEVAAHLEDVGFTDEPHEGQKAPVGPAMDGDPAQVDEPVFFCYIMQTFHLVLYLHLALKGNEEAHVSGLDTFRALRQEYSHRKGAATTLRKDKHQRFPSTRTTLPFGFSGLLQI